MALPFRPNCLPAALGVLPHTTARAAWDVCVRYVPAMLPLPLLTRAGEDPALLTADGFGGATIALDQLRFDRTAAAAALDDLYLAYLRNRWETRALSLEALDDWGQREAQVRRAEVVSTVLMGPISMALRLVDDEGLPALDDEVAVDALAKHLSLRLQWQQRTLGRSAKVLLHWLYEPYLDVIGSPFSPLDWPAVCRLLDEAFGFVQRAPGGVSGLWVSMATDLPRLLEGTTVGVVGLSLPLPNVVDAWAPALQDFIRRKGVIGWGLVPQTGEGLANARVGRLAARFTATLRALEAAGVPTAEVVAASLIMPEDTLGDLDPGEADAALAMTHQVAGLLRHAYGLD